MVKIARQKEKWYRYPFESVLIPLDKGLFLFCII